MTAIPIRTCLVDTANGDRYSFAERQEADRSGSRWRCTRTASRTSSRSRSIGPNSAVIMVALLSIWRANGKWIPVNTRNAIDANAGYLNYVRCGWMFYHSSLADDVAELRAQVGTLTHFVCLDKPMRGDPSLEHFVAGSPTATCPTCRDPFGTARRYRRHLPDRRHDRPVQGRQRHQSRLGHDDRDDRRCGRRANRRSGHRSSSRPSPMPPDRSRSAPWRSARPR